MQMGRMARESWREQNPDGHLASTCFFAKGNHYIFGTNGEIVHKAMDKRFAQLVAVLIDEIRQHLLPWC